MAIYAGTTRNRSFLEFILLAPSADLPQFLLKAIETEPLIAQASGNKVNCFDLYFYSSALSASETSPYT
jgi:hypothetical protein